jgi:asparagine synthase (glutamine-hydrolysing)
LIPVGAGSCLAFSGGVDSSLLATFLKRKLKDITLLSINFLEYGEVEFIRKAAYEIGIPLILKNISITELEEGIKDTLRIIEYDRVALLENCIGFYFIFKYAEEIGFNYVISANGVDELFCGYDIFRSLYKKTEINELIDNLVETAQKDKVQRDKLSDYFNLDYICPFLNEKVIEYSRNIPVSLKIKNCNDFIRKHFIRKVAEKQGLPNKIVNRKKNSFQYSSGLHKAIRKLSRIKGYTNQKGKKLGYESGAKAYIKNLEKETKGGSA